MRIGVTSCNSKLGNEIITELLQFTHKQNIIAISNSETNNYFDLLTRKVNRSNISETFKGMNILILLAEEDFIKNHFNTILESCKINKVQKIILNSYIDNEIVEIKLKSYLKKTKIPYIIIKQNLLIEDLIDDLPLDKFNTFINNIGTNGVCRYTSIKELAFCFAKAALSKNKNFENKTFNIGGEQIEPNDLLKTINLIYKSDYKNNYTHIGKIGKKIDNGVYNISSDFELIAEKKHKTIHDMIKTIYESNLV